MNRNLVIVSGASNGIGGQFYAHFRAQRDTTCIGISRTGENLLHVDLLDAEKTAAAVAALSLDGIKSIIHIHSIGIDKFEPSGKPHIDHDGDGIDDEVYATNVTAFFNLANPLVQKASEKKIPLLFCHIGSVSDSYTVPLWQSFSRCKNIIRKFLRFNTYPHVKGVFLNISSTMVEKSNGGGQYARPLADTAYWMNPRQLVEAATPHIEGFGSKLLKYAEFDFVNPSPRYSETYFTDLPKLYATWQKDMGFEGKQIPEGIRI
jgi:NAD(P)-dependent dehydrogenase (short-subunit alcohol dehydrogenase family)